MASTRADIKRAVAAVTAIAAAVAVVLAAGCRSGSSIGAKSSQPNQPSPQNPVTTTDSDWKPVADALGRGGPTEQPRLFYMHFWSVDDAVTLAKALRPALDATNVKPA